MSETTWLGEQRANSLTQRHCVCVEPWQPNSCKRGGVYSRDLGGRLRCPDWISSTDTRCVHTSVLRGSWIAATSFCLFIYRVSLFISAFISLTLSLSLWVSLSPSLQLCVFLFFSFYWSVFLYHTHNHAHTQTNTRTHTHACMRTPARTHGHTHTHTHWWWWVSIWYLFIFFVCLHACMCE